MTKTHTGGKLALLVGGGPAPGINGVISSVTIEAIDYHDMEVIGILDGFKEGWRHYRILQNENPGHK